MKLVTQIISVLLFNTFDRYSLFLTLFVISFIKLWPKTWHCVYSTNQKTRIWTVLQSRIKRFFVLQSHAIAWSHGWRNLFQRGVAQVQVKNSIDKYCGLN